MANTKNRGLKKGGYDRVVCPATINWSKVLDTPKQYKSVPLLSVKEYNDRYCVEAKAK